ncbi:hypothetical protein Tco_0649917 [Tanacetum coccineum]
MAVHKRITGSTNLSLAALIHQQAVLTLVTTMLLILALKNLETVILKKFQDTANSGQKKETKAMVFYQMDTKEVSDRFVAPCFVNGLEAYDGEINLRVEENMISNEYAVKLCLEHEVKNKWLRRNSLSFLHMTKAITDFRVGTVTIYLDIDPFLEETKEEEKSNEDWDHLLDLT